MIDFESIAEQADSLPPENAEGPNQGTAQDTQPEQVEAPGKDHPGYNPVDLSSVPEEFRKPIEERFGYFFKQDKARQRQLNDALQVMQEQSQRIDELTNGVGQVVGHLQNQSNTAREAQLESEMQAAFDAGDNVAYVKAQTDLIALRVQKTQPKQPVQKQVQKPKDQYPSLGEVGADLPYEDQALLSSWAGETDQSGNKVRPWTEIGDPNLPNPDYVRAVVIANNLTSKNPNMTINQVLTELDKQMGTKQRQPSQSVMGGNLTIPRNGAKLSLSKEQQDVARRLRVGGKNASPEQSLARYKEQLEKSKAKGGR